MDPARGPTQGTRLLWRVGATLFALLILIYWGIGLQFSFAYGLLNEQQAQQTLMNYLWELPAIGVPVGVLVPLFFLRKVAADYDRMLRGEALPDPERSAERILGYPRRMVWYFTPVSIAAYFLGGLQTWQLHRQPFDEFVKGIPLGLPLGLLISLSAYLLLVHYLEPVRRLFIQRHGYAAAPPPRTSIYRKVVVSSITIVALSLALLWLIAYAQGQTLLEDQLHERMAESTLPDALALAAERDAAGFDERLAGLHLGPHGYAFLVDGSGAVLSGHPRGARTLADEGWDPALRDSVLRSGSGRFTDRVDVVRLVAHGQVPGTTQHMVVVTFRDDFAGPLAGMTLAMLATTGLGIVVATLLTLTGARAITKPVRELTEAMRRAGDDGTGGEVALATDDEVGALAGSYAAMMQRLREKTQALEGSVLRLSEMDAMKTRFINIASHELRTPMTPIRTELHLIQTGKRGALTPEQAKGMQMIARNVDRLNRLIRELLEASRMQAGHLKLFTHRVSLAEVVDSVMTTMLGEARIKEIHLEAHVPPEAWVHADPDRLAQVLINLLENALQFTPRGGRVQVLADVEGREARVEVRDSGVGIEPALIPRLFQPFSQAEPGMPRTEGGTGLGLFICKGIVEGHHGRIWCESEGKGLGTSFLFTLPLDDASPAPAEAPEPEAAQPPRFT